MATPARKVEYDAQPTSDSTPVSVPQTTPVEATKPERKIPPPGRCQSFEEAKNATFEQFREALAELAK